MESVPTDRIANLESVKGHYVWGCGPYRAECLWMAGDKAHWAWRVWKEVRGFKPVSGAHRTLWQAQHAALAELKRLTGVGKVDTFRPPNYGANRPPGFRDRPPS